MQRMVKTPPTRGTPATQYASYFATFTLSPSLPLFFYTSRHVNAGLSALYHSIFRRCAGVRRGWRRRWRMCRGVPALPLTSSFFPGGAREDASAPVTASPEACPVFCHFLPRRAGNRGRGSLWRRRRERRFYVLFFPFFCWWPARGRVLILASTHAESKRGHIHTLGDTACAVVLLSDRGAIFLLFILLRLRARAQDMLRMAAYGLRIRSNRASNGCSQTLPLAGELAPHYHA
ncbi:hypothetical protein B0H16DRAFT_202123 [Mycena metata]|uniref:Uncharacterized protein n=1 Tax=Mycena metata TaxID=1033252 RepID=A0AAD7MT31_9AGAR|nr:hypothetical protein B0H16DRAFT_202123 [Mycena metata]